MKMNSILGSFLLIGLCIYSVSCAPSPNPESDGEEQAQQDEGFKVKPEMLTLPTNNVVSPGDDVILKCEIKNRDPEASVLWQLINKYTIAVDGVCYEGPKCNSFHVDTKDNTLRIKKVTDDMAGDYRCEFRNVSVVHSVSTKANVESVSGPKTIEFGDDLVLNCRVSGSPPPPVIWYRQPNEGAAKIVMGDSQNLTIQHVNLGHSGIYTCTVLNADKQPLSSRSMNVNVVKGLGAQSPVVNASDKLGSNVDLCCVYSPAKKTATIKWLKNGKEVTSGPRHTITPSKTISCLQIMTVKEEDLGRYTCQFAKELPYAVETALTSATVDLLGYPSAPEFISTSYDSAKTPIVKYRVKTFSPLISYQINAKKPEQSEKDWVVQVNKTITSDKKEETIEQSLDALSNGMYDVELVVENKFGFNKLVSNNLVAVDRDVVDVKFAGSLEKQGNGNGAASSIRISFFCVLLGIVLSRL